jgi:REP element-mobilizing transposase RayT
MNLFSITDFYDEIYKWFDIMVALSYHILGYVIMQNHLHYVIHAPRDKKSLNKRVGNGKRFMAYEIVERLKQRNYTDILKILSEDVKPYDRRGGKLHQVFIDSFDAREIFDEQMLKQKLDYIHHNPVSG